MVTVFLGSHQTLVSLFVTSLSLIRVRKELSRVIQGEVMRTKRGWHVQHLQSALEDVGAGESPRTIDGNLAGTVDAELRADTLNTVSGVDVLHEGDLPACGTALAGGDGGCGEEIFPNLKNQWGTEDKQR